MEPRKSEQTGQGTQQRPPEQQERPVRREQGEPIGQTMRVIDAIDRLLADAYRVPLSKSKCVVDASEMEDLLGQLRMALPRAVTMPPMVVTMLVISLPSTPKARASPLTTPTNASRNFRLVSLRMISFIPRLPFLRLCRRSRLC